MHSNLRQFGEALKMDNGVRTSTVFKAPILCPHCNVSYLFTWQAIADCMQLKCPGCRIDIDLRSDSFRAQVTHLKRKIAAMEEWTRTPIALDSSLYAATNGKLAPQSEQLGWRD